MKNKSLKLVVLLAASFGVSALVSSCGKGKENTSEQNVEISTGSIPFQIPSFKTTGDIDSMTYFKFEINMDSFVKSFSSRFDTASIQKVSLKYAFLSCDTNQTLDNFSNFHTINLGLKSGTESRFLTRFASMKNISDTDAYILTVPAIYEPNMKEYFKSDSLSYIIYGNVRDTNSSPIKGHAELVFNMKLVK